jgi:hypothetical protein
VPLEEFVTDCVSLVPETGRDAVFHAVVMPAAPFEADLVQASWAAAVGDESKASERGPSAPVTLSA